jgi:carbamoyl-phosphate synthase large subunit
MSEPFGVLISSAGRRVALLEIFRHTIRDLALTGPIVAVDSSRLSGAFHSADHAEQVPPCTSAEFVPAVLDVCARFGIGLVVPTIDPELGVYAEHREAFRAAGVTVAISGSETTTICEDKRRTHAWLVANGFPTVRQATMEEFAAGNNGWRYPVVVKPRRGSASIGVAVVSGPAELPPAAAAGDYVVQSVASGSEFTVDALVDRAGRCVSVVPRRRLEVRSGESSKGVTARSDVLESQALRLSESLPGAYGPLTIQSFLDPESGEAAVIEINARFGGGFPLAWRAGADHPRWLIEDLLGRTSSASRRGWREGLVMLRYDEAVFVDAREAGL